MIIIITLIIKIDNFDDNYYNFDNNYYNFDNNDDNQGQ